MHVLPIQVKGTMVHLSFYILILCSSTYW
jgi:hypothetical protein